MPEAPTLIRRDVRIDHCGYAAELGKHFYEKVRPRLKETLLDKAAGRASGDHFEALIVSGGSVRVIDKEAFVNLFVKGKISREQFLEAISVHSDKALNCLSRDALGAISTEARIVPQLRITRIKGVELTLLDEVTRLAAGVK